MKISILFVVIFATALVGCDKPVDSMANAPGVVEMRSDAVGQQARAMQMARQQTPLPDHVEPTTAANEPDPVIAPTSSKPSPANLPGKWSLAVKAANEVGKSYQSLLGVDLFGTPNYDTDNNLGKQWNWEGGRLENNRARATIDPRSKRIVSLFFYDDSFDHTIMPKLADIWPILTGKPLPARIKVSASDVQNKYQEGAAPSPLTSYACYATGTTLTGQKLFVYMWSDVSPMTISGHGINPETLQRDYGSKLEPNPSFTAEDLRVRDITVGATTNFDVRNNDDYKTDPLIALKQ